MPKQIIAPDGKVIGELKESELVFGDRDKNYCPTCGAPRDYRHIQTDLEIEKDRHQRDMEKTEQQIGLLTQKYQEALDPNHSQHCSGGNCEINQVHQQIRKQGYDEAYLKGKADGKKNLTPDDLTIDLIGEYFRQRGIMGIAKTEKGGEYKPFKGIKVPGGK